MRKKDIHPTKMQLLESKFDDVRNDGLLMPSAVNTAIQNDEPDTAILPTPRTRLVKRAPSASARKPNTLDVFASGIDYLAHEKCEAVY